jgi:hypothetical protein
VKILIDISLEHYDRLLSELTDESRIYTILKNGVVIHQFERGADFRTVEIPMREISCTNDSRYS